MKCDPLHVWYGMWYKRLVSSYKKYKLQTLAGYASTRLEEQQVTATEFKYNEIKMLH